MASYRKMTERLMTEASAIARKRNTTISPEILREAAENIQNNGRKKAPPPPEGGISLREAEKKYNIPNRTISRWVQKGFVPLLLETRNAKYIDESKFAELVSSYQSKRITGRRTIKKAIALLNSKNN